MYHLCFDSKPKTYDEDRDQNILFHLRWQNNDCVYFIGWLNYISVNLRLDMQQYQNTLKAEYAKSEDEKQDIDTFNFEGNLKKKMLVLKLCAW